MLPIRSQVSCPGKSNKQMRNTRVLPALPRRRVTKQFICHHDLLPSAAVHLNGLLFPSRETDPRCGVRRHFMTRHMTLTLSQIAVSQVSRTSHARNSRGLRVESGRFIFGHPRAYAVFVSEG